MSIPPRASELLVLDRDIHGDIVSSDCRCVAIGKNNVDIFIAILSTNRLVLIRSPVSNIITEYSKNVIEFSMLLFPRSCIGKLENVAISPDGIDLLLISSRDNYMIPIELLLSIHRQIINVNDRNVVNGDRKKIHSCHPYGLEYWMHGLINNNDEGMMNDGQLQDYIIDNEDSDSDVEKDNIDEKINVSDDSGIVSRESSEDISEDMISLCKVCCWWTTPDDKTLAVISQHSSLIVYERVALDLNERLQYSLVLEETSSDKQSVDGRQPASKITPYMPCAKHERLMEDIEIDMDLVLFIANKHYHDSNSGDGVNSGDKDNWTVTIKSLELFGENSCSMLCKCICQNDHKFMALDFIIEYNTNIKLNDNNDDGSNETDPLFSVRPLVAYTLSPFGSNWSSSMTIPIEMNMIRKYCLFGVMNDDIGIMNVYQCRLLHCDESSSSSSSTSHNLPQLFQGQTGKRVLYIHGRYCGSIFIGRNSKCEIMKSIQTHHALVIESENKTENDISSEKHDTFCNEINTSFMFSIIGNKKMTLKQMLSDGNHEAFQSTPCLPPSSVCLDVYCCEDVGSMINNEKILDLYMMKTSLVDSTSFIVRSIFYSSNSIYLYEQNFTNNEANNSMLSEQMQSVPSTSSVLPALSDQGRLSNIKAKCALWGLKECLSLVVVEEYDRAILLADIILTQNTDNHGDDDIVEEEEEEEEEDEIEPEDEGVGKLKDVNNEDFKSRNLLFLLFLKWNIHKLMKTYGSSSVDSIMNKLESLLHDNKYKKDIIRNAFLLTALLLTNQIDYSHSSLLQVQNYSQKNFSISFFPNNDVRILTGFVSLMIKVALRFKCIVQVLECIASHINKTNDDIYISDRDAKLLIDEGYGEELAVVGNGVLIMHKLNCFHSIDIIEHELSQQNIEEGFKPMEISLLTKISSVLTSNIACLYHMHWLHHVYCHSLSIDHIEIKNDILNNLLLWIGFQDIDEEINNGWELLLHAFENQNIIKNGENESGEQLDMLVIDIPEHSQEFVELLIKCFASEVLICDNAEGRNSSSNELVMRSKKAILFLEILLKECIGHYDIANMLSIFADGELWSTAAYLLEIHQDYPLAFEMRVMPFLSTSTSTNQSQSSLSSNSASSTNNDINGSSGITSNDGVSADGGNRNGNEVNRITVELIKVLETHILNRPHSEGGTQLLILFFSTWCDHLNLPIKTLETFLIAKIHFELDVFDMQSSLSQNNDKLVMSETARRVKLLLIHSEPPVTSVPPPSVTPLTSAASSTSASVAAPAEHQGVASSSSEASTCSDTTSATVDTSSMQSHRSETAGVVFQLPQFSFEFYSIVILATTSKLSPLGTHKCDNDNVFDGDSNKGSSSSDNNSMSISCHWNQIIETLKILKKTSQLGHQDNVIKINLSNTATLINKQSVLSMLNKHTHSLSVRRNNKSINHLDANINNTNRVGHSMEDNDDISIDSSINSKGIDDDIKGQVLSENKVVMFSCSHVFSLKDIIKISEKLHKSSNIYSKPVSHHDAHNQHSLFNQPTQHQPTRYQQHHHQEVHYIHDSLSPPPPPSPSSTGMLRRSSSSTTISSIASRIGINTSTTTSTAATNYTHNTNVDYDTDMSSNYQYSTMDEDETDTDDDFEAVSEGRYMSREQKMSLSKEYGYVHGANKRVIIHAACPTCMGL